MTVSNTESRKTYAGNDVTQTFGTSPVDFFATSDLDVYVVVTATGAETLLVENTDYAITAGAGDPTPLTPDYRTYGGTVDLSAGGDPYGPPATGTTLVIVRNLPLIQEVDLVNNDINDAEVTEAAFDKLTMVAQQLDARIERSFTLPDSDVSGASTQLPTPEASTLLGWDATGTALKNYAGAVSVPVSTFMATVLDDTNASAALTTLGVSAFAKTLLDDADAATARATLGDVATLAGNEALTNKTVNKVTLTAPANGATITVVDGKTLTIDKSIEFDGTDGTKMTFPATSATLARTDAANATTGTITDDSAAAGKLGEALEANAVNNDVNTTGQQLLSLALTAGDWDVSGVAQLNGADATANTAMLVAINTTAASITGTLGKDYCVGAIDSAHHVGQVAIPPFRVSLAAPTTYYLNAAMYDGAVTAAVNSHILARRVR